MNLLLHSDLPTKKLINEHSDFMCCLVRNSLSFNKFCEIANSCCNVFLSFVFFQWSNKINTWSVNKPWCIDAWNCVMLHHYISKIWNSLNSLLEISLPICFQTSCGTFLLVASHEGTCQSFCNYSSDMVHNI